MMVEQREMIVAHKLRRWTVLQPMQRREWSSYCMIARLLCSFNSINWNAGMQDDLGFSQGQTGRCRRDDKTAIIKAVYCRMRCDTTTTNKKTLSGFHGLTVSLHCLELFCTLLRSGDSPPRQSCSQENLGVASILKFERESATL